MPALLYPLQPAPHFAGREELLSDLTRWVRDASDPNRVVALVAPGGTGKTALAERVLSSLTDYSAAGVLVWSFYENPQTEAFLRAACEYVLGETVRETGGLLERLQKGLVSNDAHVFILDGLEVVQATGTSGRPRGEMENPLLKRFLRWLAAGLGTRAKALITSRFPLPDLADWTSRGFRPVDLGDLDAAAGRAVFRRWGVRGTDDALNGLGESVHWHALTVDVLGSFLGTFHGGDPERAPAFDPVFLLDTDAKTARLHRVLTGYAERLQPRERDLLARLSMFPRGVSLKVLGYVADAGGPVAATLVGCGQADLLKLLERLRSLGLVFRYDLEGLATFTAHPFLRGFFEKLHGLEDGKQIHEVVRAKLAPNLDERPKKKPIDPADLDRYEHLIEETRLAGAVEDAFNLFINALGGTGHLVGWLGELARAHRILASFTDGVPTAEGTAHIPDGVRSLFLLEWCRCAIWLGDLTLADQLLATLNQCEADDGLRDLTPYVSHFFGAQILMLRGCWPAALARFEEASLVIESMDETGDSKDHFRHSMYPALLIANSMSGQLAEVRRVSDLIFGLHFQTQLLLGLRLFSADRDDYDMSFGQTFSLLENIADSFFLPGETPLRRALLRLVRERTSDANDNLERVLRILRQSCEKSGDVNTTIRCYLMAGVVARQQHDIPAALAEVRNGIQLAESCGLLQWSLDGHLELARTYLAAKEPTNAIGPAKWVLEQSQKSDCQYAWGVADSLHLLGVAHAHLDDVSIAQKYFASAVEKRRALEHPALAETEAELVKLKPDETQFSTAELGPAADGGA